MLLGVNIDHIAVLREARKINDPDPLEALGIVKRSGADQITIHLREDRRHIHDEDAQKIIASSPLPVNLECSLNEQIIECVTRLRPHRATLVPEKREEVTTEGGLDILSHPEKLAHVIERLHAHEIEVSLFVDPCKTTMLMAAELGVEWVELHTGAYANLYAMLYTNLAATHHSIDTLKGLTRKALHVKLQEALEALQASATLAGQKGLRVAAGHGLNYHNVKAICAIEEIEELNIGQSIIARSIFVGLERAIKEMREVLV